MGNFLSCSSVAWGLKMHKHFHPYFMFFSSSEYVLWTCTKALLTSMIKCMFTHSCIDRLFLKPWMEIFLQATEK